MSEDPQVQSILDGVTGRWRPDVLPLLEEFARIPDVSPAFQPDWEETGHLAAAAELLARWASKRSISGATVEILRFPGLTPTVVVDVPANHPDATGSVLIYGHYDKQPPFEGWTGDRGPWTPVIEGDRLYARGVADDGYALPSALVAIEAVEAAGGRHGRCIVVAEGSEESGSPHLPEVLARLSDRIGTPDLVVALDSGCPTYDRLWITTSLRGFIEGTLTVTVLEHGVHSGAAGGVVPSSFRLIRGLLDRLEDSDTGKALPEALHVVPPASSAEDARRLVAAVVEAGLVEPPFPVVAGLELEGPDAATRALANAWETSVAVVGAEGLPPIATAGNVLLPSTSLKLVIRTPPTCDAAKAVAAVERVLTSDPPAGAQVRWEGGQGADGWAASPLEGWLSDALEGASLACFGKAPASFGEGGSIPFMGWLAERFPRAQLIATGVLGPGSNAHGPDESLHLPTAERITGSLAIVLDAHGRRSPR